MPEAHEIRFQLRQLPLFDLDVADPRAVRDWRLRCIVDEVQMTGALPTRMVLVGQGVQRIGDLPPKLEADAEIQYAAMFRMCATQPEIARAYREGEISVPGPDDTRVRVAVCLEYAHDTHRWWLAQRRVGTGAASVGVFHGEWEEREGEGLDALDDALREWVDTTGVDLGASSQVLTPKEDVPDVLLGVFELPEVPPPDPKVYAQIVGDALDPQLRDGLPLGISILTFQGRRVEHVFLEGQIALPLDDLIRAFAARASADAVAVRMVDVIQLGQESYRAVLCSVEAAGRLYIRAVALQFGPDGRPSGYQPLERDGGPVPPEGLWLGVPPKNGDVTLFRRQAPGGEAPEG
jgi:hypothetical protein